jgi:4-amino-4-deoxy-L-arabinose transferase-like glycosyltransferase
MTKDTFQLLQYGLIAVLLIAIWFGLISLSRNIVVEIPLGWIGFAAFALYWRWLKRKKIEPPKS